MFTIVEPIRKFIDADTFTFSRTTFFVLKRGERYKRKSQTHKWKANWRRRGLKVRYHLKLSNECRPFINKSS